VGFGLDFASCGILHCTPSDAALLLQEFFFALKIASFVISTLLCLGRQAYGDMQMMSSAGSRPMQCHCWDNQIDEMDNDIDFAEQWKNMDTLP
jgi:hypothetical protein